MDRIYYTTVTVPSGTPITAPFTVATPLEDNQLINVTLIVPDGHCGLTGIRLLQSGQQVFPWANNSYIVANNERIDWPYEDQISSSGIVAEGYNTDIFNHSFYLRFTITNLPEPGAEPEAQPVAAQASQSAYFSEPDEFDTSSIVSEPYAPTILPYTPPPVPPKSEPFLAPPSRL